jgi:hypothetical protein
MDGSFTSQSLYMVNVQWRRVLFLFRLGIYEGDLQKSLRHCYHIGTLAVDRRTSPGNRYYIPVMKCKNDR